MSELDASLCRQRVRIPTIIIRELYEVKQKVCSSIHELEKWFWRKASMSETDYSYILAKRTRGKFYLPSIGFPLQEHLRAKKLKTNTNRGSAAKSYREKWAWISRRVKRLCTLWTFQSILFLLEGRKSTKILNWKKFLNGIEGLNWMHRYAQIEFENQAESYVNVMTKNKRRLPRNMNWKVCLEVQRKWIGRTLSIF